jgi:hypothetical protein
MHLEGKVRPQASGGDFRLGLMTATEGLALGGINEGKVEQSEGLRAHAFHASGPDRGGHQGEQR